MPRVYVFRSIVIMAVLAASDLADGESVVTEGVLVYSLVVANCWLAGNIIGWVLAVTARRAPPIDTVMMRFVIPYVCSFELVRKIKARMEAGAEMERERVRRRLTPG